jgi:catechol 2,3-dioxygenase-like lactoylglutathione lyase family enzyme
VRALRRAGRLAALFVILWGTLAVAQQPARPLVTGVDSVAITVGDMERELDFFTRVLPFKKVSDQELSGDEFERRVGVFGAHARVVRLQLGDEYLELVQYLAPEGRPVPTDSRSNDRWFQHVAIIVRNMDQAYALLRRHHVRHASSAPQRLPDWNKNAGGIEAFYFKDPEGHVLEILAFPSDKGAAKWHRPGSDLFLGIDHTAIVVADTEASLRFYRDLLGMKVAGESENHGTEQEHLNNVFSAHLRITGLRAASGFGVELLEYITPRDGRPYPGDLRANDLAFYLTKLTGDPDVAWRAALAARAMLVSSAPNRASPAFVVRDPDGHAVEIRGHTVPGAQ